MKRVRLGLDIVPHPSYLPSDLDYPNGKILTSRTMPRLTIRKGGPPLSLLTTPYGCELIEPHHGARDGLVQPAVAVQELLRGSKWSLVQFLGAFDQAKLPAKLIVK